MSIINVIEDWRERRSVGDVKSGGQEYRVFTVLLDENDNPIIRPCLAKNAPGVPMYFEQHPADPYCYVQNKVAEAISPALYKVTVQYGYAEGTSGTGETTDPLEQPDIWSSNFEAQHVPIDSAYSVVNLYGTAIGSPSNNNSDPVFPVVNTAGEFFDQPITEQTYDLVKRCVGNRNRYDEIQAAEYIGCINNSGWKGFPPYVVRLTQWSHEMMQAGDIIYYRHTWEFRVRWEGWLRKTLNTGYDEVGAVDTDHPDGLWPIQRNGVDATTPSNLDDAGHVLVPGQPLVYRVFRTVRTMDFGNIDV